MWFPDGFFVTSGNHMNKKFFFELFQSGRELSVHCRSLLTPVSGGKQRTCDDVMGDAFESRLPFFFSREQVHARPKLGRWAGGRDG